MNEQNYFQANDDGIGIDPTMVSVIETLDVLPKEEIPNKPKNKGRSKTPNPDKKPGDLLKKILFTIVILALMAGVSFGVYYYLSLGLILVHWLVYYCVVYVIELAKICRGRPCVCPIILLYVIKGGHRARPYNI